mgnify:CR=1 FL=1
MELVAVLLVVAALGTLSFCVSTLYAALKATQRSSADTQELVRKFATDTLELVKAQSLMEKAQVDAQRDIMVATVPLEEQGPENEAVKVKTVDGKMIDLAGGEWELL